jgi:DNA-3-methyladenine glycosylase II
VVDTLTAGGRYRRVLTGVAPGVVVEVVQPRPDALVIHVDGRGFGRDDAVALVERVLGVSRDLTAFYRAAAAIPWLESLVRRFRGLRPPRYPTLWEACVNAIAFQQVSVPAASAIVRRMVVALGHGVERDGVVQYSFPSPDRLLTTDDGVLRQAGLSASKTATIRRVGEMLASGLLDEEVLEGLPSAEAAASLTRIKGIGLWTATVILIRGLGRLDVFPLNDSGVARSLALVADSTADPGAVASVLGAQRGMLYFHLLLARLERLGYLA